MREEGQKVRMNNKKSSHQKFMLGLAHIKQRVDELSESSDRQKRLKINQVKDKGISNSCISVLIIIQ